MLGYITIGANDLARSGRFWAAVLVPLGYAVEETAEGFAFTWPDGGVPAVYVKRPFDGGVAGVGNGGMAAFAARSQALVREVHAAGLAAGGTDEGAPGFRAAYSAEFYVGYLRDPVGNKVGVYCSEPGEPTRWEAR